ncbi:MAG TPA: Rid family hydrolase [Burkholderiales bacterium]|nr:Rid family hydrolase [Burkholderiales bacterium]
MANIEVRSVEGLAGSAVPYAYAVKAGPWLFLTGHEAFDFATGLAPEVEGPAGFPSFGAPRLKREAEYILKRMRKTLAEFGSDFKSSVRVDQYYPVFEAVRAYQLARHGEFGDYIPPSTSVLMKRLFKANSHISMSMIAVVPGKDYEIGKLYPKEVPVPVGSFFVPAITCNDFVFVAGQMASDENALDPSVRLPKEVRNWGGPNAIRRQTEFVIKKRLEPALKAAGSTWKDILKAQIYVPTAVDIPDALDVWQQHVGAHPCALTAVPTHGFGFIDGIVEINLLALRDGARRKKEVLKVDLPAMSMYGAVVRAGELVFCSGLMPLGADGHVIGSATFDGLAHPAHVQALAALSSAEKICRAAGTSLANIVRAQWFMSDVTQFPGVELAWMGRQGKQPHPFVCVQVPGDLPAPGAALTADFWIYAP